MPRLRASHRHEAIPSLDLEGSKQPNRDRHLCTIPWSCPSMSTR